MVRQHGVGQLIKGLEVAEGIGFPDWFWRHMMETDREMFALQLLGAAEWRGPWSLLREIQCAVLMLVGELEDPEGDTCHAASVLPNARCVTLRGLGHVGAYLRSDLALGEAVPFLTGLYSMTNDANR